MGDIIQSITVVKSLHTRLRSLDFILKKEVLVTLTEIGYVGRKFACEC